MAVIRLHDSIFEQDFKEITYDTSKSLMQQIEELDSNSYDSLMVECYDCETGETYFEPMVDDEGNKSVTIIVDNNIVDENYEVKENDIVEVIFIPMAMARGWALVLGALAGVVLGGAIGAGIFSAVYGTSYVTGALGTIVAGLKGAAVGGLIGLYAGGAIWDKNNAEVNSSKEKTQRPDIRGASNQALTGNAYPFLIGKHLVTPFVNASPVTEYTGEYGEQAYIKVMHCLGYGPLKLTEFKLADTVLAYNKPYKNTQRDTVLSGLLKGYGNDDSGDILNIWKNNDVQIEIIQQLKGQELNHGTIFPDTIKDSVINTNILFIADKNLSDIASTVYKGTSYPSNFKTNTVKNTERCPMKFSVTIDFENGLYSSHSENTNTGSTTEYEQIPLWFAVQWRVKKRSDDVSQSDGSDYFLWHTITKFNNKEIGSIYDRTKFKADIAAHKGNVISDEIVNAKKKQYYVLSTTEDTFDGIFGAITEFKNSKYNGYRHSYVGFSSYANFGGVNIPGLKCTFDAAGGSGPSSVSKWFDNGDSYKIGNLVDEADPKSCHDKSGVIYDPTSQTLYIGFYSDAVVSDSGARLGMDIGGDFIVYKTNTARSLTLYDCSSVNENFKTTPIRYTQTVQVKSIAVPGNIYKYAESDIYNDVAQYWLGKKLANFQSWSGEDHISQMRATATVDLTEYPDDIKTMMDVSLCPTQSVEIRIIRVSPNYINQSSTDSKTSGPYSYSDTAKWLTVSTTPFDEDVYLDDGTIQPLKAIKEEDLEGFCYLAFKAKADTTGNLEGSLGKFNCIAESFSPYWDSYKNKWFPENVHKVTKYYGYYTDNTKAQKCDRSNTAYEEEVTKEQFETARQEGYSWIRKHDGSSFGSQIRDITLSPYAYVKDGKYYFESECLNEIKGSYTYESTTQNNKKLIKHNNVVTGLLSPTAERYNDRSVASAFVLALVGQQNGPFSKGYEDIDMLSVADGYNFGLSVKDGSTYNRDTYIGGIFHAKGEEVVTVMECNTYIYQQQKLEDLLAKIASSGRAMFTYDEYGRIKMVVDNKVDYPKGSFSQQTIIDRSEAYTYEDNLAGYLVEYNDEDNGYEKSSFYCWADGNSLKNYKGDVKSFSLPFVTNINQAFSLGRYALAASVLQRDVLTIKAGIEGKSFGLGDVVVVQTEDIELSDTSARIQELIIVEGVIRGFVTDGIYEYTEDRNDDEEITQGIQILQPGKFGQSRLVTLRLAEPGSIETEDGTTYTMNKGLTNVVIFEKDNIPAESDDKDFSSVTYNFTTGDIVMFGTYNNIGERYRIIKIKPESDGNTSFTLIPYLDELYSYGAKLPVIHTSVNAQPVEKDFTTIAEVPTTIAEQNDIQKITTSYLEEQVSNLYSNHIVNLYKRSETEITETGIQSNLIYDFSDNTLSWVDQSKNNGWSFVSNISGEGDIYVISATAFGKESTDTITPSEWSAPITQGKNGISTATIYLYTRSEQTPSKPNVDITYNFKTKSLSSVPSGWYITIPTTTDDKLWVTVATASSSKETDVIDKSEWSTPSILAENGNDGGYQDYMFLVGDFDMTNQQLLDSPDWTDEPTYVPDGKCLYMATKWISPNEQ